MKRRAFTTTAIKVLFAGVVITISEACGGGSDGPTAPSGGGSSGDSVNGSVSANHGHTATITRAQLNEGGTVTLNIRGDADHAHTVQLSAGQVTQIAGGTRVQVESTSEQAHTHTVTFN
jgi:hypothetical protein